MSLVPSLLQAIVHVDGEALVMHAGDKPYVVSPTGQVDLASRGLALDAVNGIVNQLLPPELQRALDEFGAVQHELPAIPEFPGEHFTIVAARGGDDVWVEIRRRRTVNDDADQLPDDLFPARDEESTHPYPVFTAGGPHATIAPGRQQEEQEQKESLQVDAADIDAIVNRAMVAEPEPPDQLEPSEEPPRAPERLVAPPPPPPPPPPPLPPQPPKPAPVASQTESAPKEKPAPPQPALVVPIARNTVRFEPPPTAPEDPTFSGLERLLRLSAARGASTLYLSSESRPAVRVDGELQVLEGENVLSARDVESLLLTLMPERSHEALRTGAASEWIQDIEDVGRVRCMSFRDQRGPGGVFRLMPQRSVSADQLGLPKVAQALAVEPEGLVLVSGPRSSGKRTLLSAFVDLINRSRRDHVIMIEREISIVHERAGSFISQREVRGNDDDLLRAARSALREDPDVLVIEHLRTASLMSVALDATASGHLVVGGFPAHNATGAIDRIIDMYGPEDSRQVQLALADSLRGVIFQVLLRKNGGGRIAAREVLLNTPAVSAVIAEGKTSQLPLAIEGGRRYGMMPLNDALVALVQQGIVDGREAYRYASDRQGLVAVLKRRGVDTSFVERLA